MQSPPTPRRRGRALLRLLLLVALAVAALLAFLTSALQQQQQVSPALLVPPPRTQQQRRLTLRAVRDDTPPAHHLRTTRTGRSSSCSTPTPAPRHHQRQTPTPPARSRAGRRPRRDRSAGCPPPAAVCAMPAAERRRKPPFPAPRLVFSNATSRSPPMLQRWSGRPAIPSVATYTAPAHPPPEDKTTKSVMCACTMVRDVAKFLREWVVYHGAVGVDRFFLYDNGSQDDLAGEVRRLTTQEAGGFDITTYPWPWPKTQEAGFSYAAAAHRGACDWMAWAWAAQSTARPTKSMLRSVVAGVGPDVGQVTLGCRDFEPSGRTENPEEGVTQGYTCRRRAEERHKSLVRLDAVGPSLHHFELRPGMRWERARQARVNHYKYQAWAEFRRRVSTYVADWTQPVNQGSKDRTPGLGFQAVEPEGWVDRFCDTMLRRKWFGAHAFTNKPKPATARSS